MKSNFLGFFTRNGKRANKEIVIARKVEDIEFKIVSDTIELFSYEADKIIKIICDELKEVSSRTGQIIAQRICEEVNSKKICSASVDGGTEGKAWTIILSNNPLEFIN